MREPSRPHPFGIGPGLSLLLEVSPRFPSFPSPWCHWRDYWREGVSSVGPERMKERQSGVPTGTETGWGWEWEWGCGKVGGVVFQPSSAS